MTKDELVSAVADGAKLSKKDVRAAIDALGNLVQVEVRSGRDIRVDGLGTFSRVEREARTGRNPHTGEALQIAARRAVKFKPEKAFKDAVA